MTYFLSKKENEKKKRRKCFLWAGSTLPRPSPLFSPLSARAQPAWAASTLAQLTPRALPLPSVVAALMCGPYEWDTPVTPNLRPNWKRHRNRLRLPCPHANRRSRATLAYLNDAAATAAPLGHLQAPLKSPRPSLQHRRPILEVWPSSSSPRRCCSREGEHTPRFARAWRTHWRYSRARSPSLHTS